MNEGTTVKTSLPYGITEACSNEVIEIYRRNAAGGEGLSAYSEGSESWSWNSKRGKPPGSIPDSCGLSEGTQGMLNAYRRWGIG